MGDFYRANPDATATNMVKVPRSGNSTSAGQKTKGTDTGSFTGIALNATLTHVSIDGATQVALENAVALADGAGTAVNPDFAGECQNEVGKALRAAGDINVTQLNFTIAIVDATPDTFTVGVTHIGEATLTNLKIGGNNKTLTRA